MRMNVGSLVYVRYRDNALYRNMEPEKQMPITQEAWGLLDYDADDYIRLVVARYREPQNSGKGRAKATGLVILKKTIMEMHRIG